MIITLHSAPGRKIKLTSYASCISLLIIWLFINMLDFFPPIIDDPYTFREGRGIDMVLYLVRHGEAKREEEDPQRSLSKKGLQDIRKTASYAKGVNVRVSQIFHSGKTRALQTASVLDEYLKPVRGISATDGLNPLDDPRIFFERISKLKEDTMIVGHLPHLSRLAALILCNDKEKDIISFKTASILCLDRSEDGSWSIEWLISPSMIT